MQEQAKSAAHRMFQFSLRSWLAFTVTIGALLGWYSAQKNFERVAAQLEIKQHILDGACVQAASAFDFHGIVGQPIDNYPLIQALGNAKVVPAQSVYDSWSHQRSADGFVDHFGNEARYWERINKNQGMTYYRLLLEDGRFEGQRHHQVMIFVQDSVVLLVMEDRYTYVH